MTTRKVAIAGASGLVGSYILEYLLKDTSVSEVHALSRRNLNIEHPKLKIHIVDFQSLPLLPQVDEIYLALGTTIKQAGSQSAFQAVDFEANWAVAKAAYSAGAKRLGVVSAMNASSHSSIFYNRIKGKLEDALATLELESLVIARPSLLTGDREKLNQPIRYAEKIGTFLGRLLNPLLPANYRAVEARKVALSLVSLVPVHTGKKVLLSGEIQNFNH